MNRVCSPLSAWLAVLALLGPAAVADEIKVSENHFARFRREFAGLVSLDSAKAEIQFVSERTGRMAKLPLRFDAELLRHWAPASAEDFPQGLRVWLWMSVNDQGDPTEVRVVADEITALAIHSQVYRFDGSTAKDGKSVLKFAADGKGLPRELALTSALPEGAKLPTVGSPVYVQSAFNAGRAVRELLTAEQLETARKAQYVRFYERLEKAGLPAQVNISDDIGGELHLTFWRPHDRWLRALRPGDKVQVHPPVGSAAAFPAVLNIVTLRGNRVRAEFLAEGKYHSRVKVGDVVTVKFARPDLPADPDDPPDADRPRTREERVLWLQSSIHCACPSAGDVCAGDFLTLYMCNGHLCGRPRAVAVRVEKLIDAGKSDREILDILRSEQGPHCLRLHLVP